MPLSRYLKLLDTQARMSLKSDASRYFLGYLWWILEPLLYVLVFYLVFGVILERRGSDFIVFLMCGKLPFVWFSKTVIQSSRSIVDNAGLIGRMDLPKTLFPLAVAHEGLYKQAAVFALLLTVVVLMGYSPTFSWLWLVPIVLANYLMIVALSLVASYVVCFVRDLGMLISMGMTLLLFLSGIFWDVRALDPATAELILTVNPVAFFLDAYRQVLMHDSTPALMHLSGLALAFGALFVAMNRLMGRHSKILALKALTA